MYISTSANGTNRLRAKRNSVNTTAYQSENDLRIIERVEAETGDSALRQSIHFTTGVVSRIERQLSLGCSIIADSNLVQSGINGQLINQLPVRMECFMDDPRVVSFAMQRRITRAEVAIDQSLALSGPKLIVVGSAPMALNRLLQLHQHSPLREVVVIAAATGFANIVELKERIWESGLPCIVVRGRKGGPAAAISITNALLENSVAMIGKTV